MGLLLRTSARNALLAVVNAVKLNFATRGGEAEMSRMKERIYKYVTEIRRNF